MSTRIVCPLVTFGADNSPPPLGGLLFKFFPVKAVFGINFFKIVAVIVEIFGRSLTFFASLPHVVFAFFEKLRVSST